MIRDSCLRARAALLTGDHSLSSSRVRKEENKEEDAEAVGGWSNGVAFD